MNWHEKLQRKVKAKLPLSLMDVPSVLLRRYVHVERQSGESARAALLRVARRLADDPEWYEARMKMLNPAVSRRQQKFMCAEYGRLKRGRRSRSGIKQAAAKEFCMRRKNPHDRWYVFSTMRRTGHGLIKQFGIKQFPFGDPKRARGLMDVRGPFASKADAITAKAKAKAQEKKWQRSKTYQQRKKQYGLEDYTVNPHLRSGKWQFLGMFAKADVKSVKRILKIHGIKVKVTKDHVKGEKGMREVYVERAAWRTAYEAITRLFETGRAA